MVQRVRGGRVRGVEALSSRSVGIPSSWRKCNPFVSCAVTVGVDAEDSWPRADCPETIMGLFLLAPSGVNTPLSILPRT